MDVWPRGHRARVWATAAAVAVLAVTVVWLRAAGDSRDPSPRAAARRVVNGPPLATGASFSVNVTSFSRDADARVMAGRLMKAGLPSFAWRLNGGPRDVLVGPFVSIDEAEAAQRDVARLGYSRGRLHVDERLRSTDAVAPVEDAKANPAVVLVAAPGRLAVAFELAEEPQEVSGRRIDSTTFAVTASAGPSIDAQEWNAPSDVQLVKHVSVAADPRGMRGLEALVTVAENAVATVRLQGARVYVDVSRAQLDFDERPAAPALIQPAVEAAPPPAAPVRAARATPQIPPARAAAMPRMVASTPAAAPSATGLRTGAASPGDVARYRQAIGPIFARFEEIQPFLRSAVATPTPGGTGGDLRHFRGARADLAQHRRAPCRPRRARPADVGHPTRPRRRDAQLQRRSHGAGARGDGAVPSRQSPAPLVPPPARARQMFAYAGATSMYRHAGLRQTLPCTSVAGDVRAAFGGNRFGRGGSSGLPSVLFSAL